MASGWAKDGAVQEQIDACVEDAVKRAREQIGAGKGRTACELCGQAIPEPRRKAVPGVRRCVGCQEQLDAEQRYVSPLNRRASKDSQLR